MNKIDHRALDWKSLDVFLTVLEEGSVTRAANRLGQTQSAVSHTLDKLRIALGDPLFVRSGRGILPTERAKSLEIPVKQVLNELRALTYEREFDPKEEQMEFTVSANDFQRLLLFPELLRRFGKEGVDISFRFLQGGVPTASLLHDAYCDLIVTPFPPAGANIMQMALFRDRIACFYDAEIRDAPKSKDDFMKRQFVEVVFPNYTSALSALSSVRASELNRPKVTVPSFSDLGPFIKGTDLITTQMSAMKINVLSGFGVADLPFENDPVTLFLVWHQRDQANPAHRWLRERIKEWAREVATKVFKEES